MANSHDLFQIFNCEISIPTAKKDRMKTSKKGLRARIRKYFKDNHPEYEPKFYVQGSDKMKTGIRTREDICDLDDGVYFFRSPDVTATTLQRWVWDAVDGYTNTTPEHRKKCVRNIFAGDYEIDMPVYYKIDGKEYQLAVKDQGWEDSDSKAMINWFNSKKDRNGQLVRIVMDLKAWCDHKRDKMPNGLAMTILAADAKSNILFNERDDITLRDILKEIKRALDIKFQCLVPVTPYDDLFKNYDSTRKNNFLTSLDEFIIDADKAIDEKNQLKASRLWQNHLGNRFPDGEDENEESNGLTSNLAALKRTAVVSSPWLRTN